MSQEDGGGRTPPQAIDAEQAVLGSMMLSQEAIADAVDVLTPNDFYRPAHELLYGVLIEMYGNGQPVDAISVLAECDQRKVTVKIGTATYLHTLIASVPTSANCRFYAQIVHDKAVLRRMIAAGTRIVQMGHQADADFTGMDADALLTAAQGELFSIAQRSHAQDIVRLEDVIESSMNEIEAIEARGQGAGAIGVPTGFSELDELIHGLHPGQLVIVAGRPGLGKALALDTPLPTPTGWSTMGEVAVGDWLLGADGCPTRVVAATETMVGRSCYEVVFSDGTTVIADAEHQWETATRAVRRRGAAPLVVTTRQIAETVLCPTADGRRNHSVRLTAPLDLPDVDVPVPPYVLGVWLGDGHSAGSRITCHRDDAPHYVEAFTRVGIPAAVTAVKPNAVTVAMTKTEATCGRGHARTGHCQPCNTLWARCRRQGQPMPPCTHRPVQGRLRALGVLGDKHVPRAYLRGSERQRRALLAGLLDTDGTVMPSGQVQFTSTSVRLAADVYELIVSLGYRCGWFRKQVPGRTPESSVAHTLTFAAGEDVFRLERKRRAHQSRRPAVRLSHRMITDVRPVESVPVRCVQVAAVDGLYLASRSMIPTHNSTLALDFMRSASIRYGRASVIFSLEMGRTEIVMRLFSAEARVPLENIRGGRMSDENWARLASRLGEIVSSPLYIDDSPLTTPIEMRTKCRRLKASIDLRLVVIDYVQLTTLGRRSENRQQEVSEITRSLKLLAKELNVPVVALSQLNRNPETRGDKRPMLSDLRESGSLEQDADVVILLHREDYYDKESPRAGEADLIVAKQRNGPTRTVPVVFQGHYSRFVDMAREHERPSYVPPPVPEGWSDHRAGKDDD